MADLKYKDKKYLAKYNLSVDLFDKFNLKITDVIPLRNVFIICTDKGDKIIKKIEYSVEELEFQHAAIEYIKRSFSSEIYIPCSTWMYRLEFMRKTEIYFRDEIGLCADTYFLYQIDLRDEKLYLIYYFAL